MSPSPRRLIDIRKKQNSLETPSTGTQISSVQVQSAQDEPASGLIEAKIENGSSGAANSDGANKYENISDNGSEISDEGYRSLGLIQSSNAKRISLHSQVSNEDADTNGELFAVFSSNFWRLFITTGRLDRSSPEMTPASDETPLSEIKPESPISDEIVDPIKEIETKFAKSGIVMNDDEISVDIASNTGLRKTGFSEVLYEDNPIIAAKKASRIPKSPMLTRRKSMDNCSAIATADEDSLRRIPAYRSVRKPQQQKDRTPLKENTWNGRSSVSPTNQAKKQRPTITSETFKSPSRTASLTRNTPARSSQQFDARTRQRSSTRASSSVNTSPNKTNNSSMQSPLAQQLLEAAGKARNDAQILGKIKQILNDYASKNKINGEFDDFTATWVNNNGQLDNANDAIDNGSPMKSLSKRSSSISTSSDSNPTTSSREVPAAVISPRRSDKGLSRIPAPVRSNTGLYWQRSSSLISYGAMRKHLWQHLN